MNDKSEGARVGYTGIHPSNIVISILHHMVTQRIARSSTILLTIAALLGTVSFNGRAYAVTLRPSTVTTGDLNTLELRYVNGLLDARIDHAPLSKVLRGIVLRTGMQTRLADPLIGNWPVVASVEGMPLAEALTRILEGYSYVLYPTASGPVVIVLSTPPDPATISVKIPATLLNTSSLAQPNDAHSEKAPETLDDFQRIAPEDTLAFATADNKQALSQEDQVLIVQEQYDAILKRSLDVLDSEHRHLHAEAVAQLVGIDNPLATHALVEAARTDPDAILRAHKVEALWQHAAILKFEDETSVAALKQLSEDSDANVRKVARRAVQDMQRYLQRNASNSD